MEEELYKKIAAIEGKIDKIQETITATKKIFIWSLVITLVLFVVPLIIVLIMLPGMIDTLTSDYSGLL